MPGATLRWFLLWLATVTIISSNFSFSFTCLPSAQNNRRISTPPSVLFSSSSPYKGDRRRKRDILRSWTGNLFRSSSAARVSEDKQQHGLGSTKPPSQLPQTDLLQFHRHSYHATDPVESLSSSVAPSLLILEKDGRATSTATLSKLHPSTNNTVATTMISLPPIENNNPATTTKTPLELEFRMMIDHFTNYSRVELLSIPDPTQRKLLQGVAASAQSPAVYRAFEVLYQDLLPLRLAGRVVFQLLHKFVRQAVAQHRQEMETVLRIMEVTTDDDDDAQQQVQALRLLFVEAASKLNRRAYLTPDQLFATGMFNTTATDTLGLESPLELVEWIRRESSTTTATEEITFVGLVTGLWKCAQDMCGVDACDPREVVHGILLEVNAKLVSNNTNAFTTTMASPSQLKNRARYDSMVAHFVDWKDHLPPLPNDNSESRRMQVVRGCFVGAEIPQVVDALRIVYTDYRGLRIAGDIIFALVSQRMKQRATKKKRHR